MKKMAFVPALLVFLSSALLSTAHRDSLTPESVTFDVVSLKATYRPNEPITLRFLLTNHGEAPVRVERFMPGCSSSFFAFVELKIQDAHGREAQKSGCAADGPTDDSFQATVVAEMGRPDSWIELKRNDVYGQEGTFNVKTGKGIYTIHSSLVPARFGAKARKEIAEQGVNILHGEIEALVVKIAVR